MKTKAIYAQACFNKELENIFESQIIALEAIHNLYIQLYLYGKYNANSYIFRGLRYDEKELITEESFMELLKDNPNYTISRYESFYHDPCVVRLGDACMPYARYEINKAYGECYANLTKNTNALYNPHNQLYSLSTIDMSNVKIIDSSFIKIPLFQKIRLESENKNAPQLSDIIEECGTLTELTIRKMYQKVSPLLHKYEAMLIFRINEI